MKEVIEKLDAIEAANTAKIEEIVASADAKVEAFKAETAEKISALEAKLAEVQAPSIIQAPAKTVRGDVNRMVKEQLSDFIKGGSKFEKEIKLWESVDQHSAYLKEASALTGSGAGVVTVSNTGKTGFTTTNAAAGNLQQTLDNGSVAEIDSDYELEIEQNAPLAGTANPIYGRERIRNTGAESGSPKASQWRRRAEGNSGNSYAEVNQTASESTGSDDYISDIAAVDTQSARIRCRVIGGVSTASMTAQNVVLTDENCSGGIPLAESGVTALATSSQSIVGAINEVNGRLRVDIDYTAASSATLAVLSHGVSDGQCGSIEADVMSAPKPGTEGSAFYHIAASWWYDGTLVMGVAQVVRTPWAPATNATVLDAAEVVTVTASGSNILLNFALETGARVVGNYKVIAVTIPTPPS